MLALVIVFPLRSRDPWFRSPIPIVTGVTPSVVVKEKDVNQGWRTMLVPFQISIWFELEVLKRESSTPMVAVAVPPAPLHEASKVVASSWVAEAAARRREILSSFMYRFGYMD
jgi:hypothetical protein